MAIPLTRVTGPVLTPKGSTVTGGTVWARLGQVVRINDPDLSQMVLVSRKEKFTVGSDGVVVMDLAPNDQMVPAGVVYSVTFSVTTDAGRQSWVEHWQVPSAASVDIGSIVRVGEPSQVVMVPGPKGDPGPPGASVNAPYTLAGTDPAQIPLTVKGATSQSAALQSWTDASNNVLMSIAADGSLRSPTSKLVGTVADSAAAVAAVVDTVNAFATVGAKLLSIRNAGVEKASFDKDGTLSCYAVTTSYTIRTTNSVLSPAYGPNSTTGLSIYGSAADSASAVGIAFNNNIALTVAGAKIASFRNNGVEKAYIDKDGLLSIGPISASSNILTTGYVSASNYMYAPNVYQGPTGSFNVNGVGSIKLNGTVADAASAIAVKVTSLNSLATAGAQIAAFYSDNAITKKFAIGSQGELVLFTSAGGALADGTFWYDGTNLRVRLAGVSRTLNVT